MRSFLLFISSIIAVLALTVYGTYLIDKAIDRRWENNALIIRSVPVAFLPEYARDWESIQRQITDTKSKHITIYWSGIGGMLIYGSRFINVIDDAQKQGKKITFIIDGAAISMHAFVACKGNDYQLRKGAYLQYHAPKRGDSYILSDGDEISQKELFDECKSKRILDDNDEEQIVKQHNAIYIYDGLGKLVKSTGADL